MPVTKDASLRLCPLIAFDRIVGGRYKLRTLWTLTAGTRRYGEIRQSLVIACQGKPVTPRILSRELKELQRRGLIQRKEYRGVPPKVEYSLTDLGSRLIPVIDQIIAWGHTGAHEVSEIFPKRKASATTKPAGAARQR